MLSSSSPSRKPSFRSTNTTSTAQLSPLQRTSSSRDIASLASLSSHPSPLSPGKSRGYRTVPASYSSPTKATKSSPKSPSSSLTRSTAVLPPSPHSSNGNSKYLYANSRIPTPTPTPLSDSKPCPPQPPNTHRRANSNDSPIPRRNSGSRLSNPVRHSYTELLSIFPTFSSPPSSALTSAKSSNPSTSRTTPSPSSPGNGVGLGSLADASSPGPTSLHTRPRAPSRTQLRHASAARRLSAEGLLPVVGPTPAPLGKNENILPDDPREISNVPTTTATTTTAIPSSDFHPASNKDPHEDSKKGVSFESWTGLRSCSHLHSRSNSNSTSKEIHLRNLGEDYHGRKRKQIDPAPNISSAPPPYLSKTLEFAEVGLMAESANMGTLIGNREILGASFMTPRSILDKMDDSDNYYHVWVAVKLALEEVSYQEHGLEAVAKLAFTKLLIELGAALNGCLNHDVPHYTFVDPRKLMDPQGMDIILDQAVAVIEGLEKKELSKDRIYISSFSTAPSNRLFVISMQVETVPDDMGDHRASESLTLGLFVPLSTFLPFLFSVTEPEIIRANSDSEESLYFGDFTARPLRRIAVRVQDWLMKKDNDGEGRGGARALLVPGAENVWVCNVFGMRVAYALEPRDAVAPLAPRHVAVLDFNADALRRDQARQRKQQMQERHDSSGNPKDSAPQDSEDLETLENESKALVEDYLEPGTLEVGRCGIFEEDVTTSLPYRRTVLREKVRFHGVMLTEDNIIFVNVILDIPTHSTPLSSSQLFCTTATNTIS
ncbi:hypothetical protein ACEPAI_2634 [Sanghuangporus weigelae]